MIFRLCSFKSGSLAMITTTDPIIDDVFQCWLLNARCVTRQKQGAFHPPFTLLSRQTLGAHPINRLKKRVK